MQRRGSLRGDCRVTPTGIGDANTKPETCEGIAGSKMTEQRPWFKLGINLWYDFGDTEISGCRNRPWEQCVEVIAYPVRVRTAGPGGQHVGVAWRSR